MSKHADIKLLACQVSSDWINNSPLNKNRHTKQPGQALTHLSKNGSETKRGKCFRFAKDIEAKKRKTGKCPLKS